MQTKPPVTKEDHPEEFDPSKYTSLQFDKILAAHHMPGFILKAALIVQQKTYMTAKDYFLLLTDYELMELFAYTNALMKSGFTMQDGNPKQTAIFLNFTLLSTILLVGEGESIFNEKHLTTAIPNLALITVAEVKTRQAGEYFAPRHQYSVTTDTETLREVLSDGKTT